MPKILCVAEKPSIAKAVSEHLAGQRLSSRRTGADYVMNYDFNFSFSPPWGNCSVTMTSVIGHLHIQDFAHAYRGWKSCHPSILFEAPIENFIDDKKRAIADNIDREARHAKGLFIWTDCDREGEYIGSEVSQIALRANPKLEVKRAKFSNIERTHVFRAAQNPVDLDERQVSAVAARFELDLRIGASFTRLQTLSIQPLGPELQNVISYGSCQFPTLGFVVDRYFRVRNFVPETFWHIRVSHLRDDIDVNFSWRRVHLFDRMAVTILFERCINSHTARVTKVQTKPTSKWRPLPLTTVELQKLGSRLLGMDSQMVMKVAEELYTKGFISYPRTETDQFDRGMDLKALIEKQTVDANWGAYAQGLLGGGFRQPRAGRNNDQAHPPIHPVSYAAGNALATGEHRRIYEFVVRRFLACCSEDAKGEATTIEIEFGDENFHTHGLLVRERNYLDVYPYERWESSQQLPNFTVGERFVPTEAIMVEGQTGPPGYLTEPELIALMDANGIGTDATMAEHIAKIKEREYVICRPRSGAVHHDGNGDERVMGGARGSRGQRGRGRGSRGARVGSGGVRGGGNTVQEFIPSTLGVALVEGYNNMGFEPSLSKPFLRKEMELKMKAICEGRKTRSDVVEESLGQYREVFIITSRRIDVLKATVHNARYKAVGEIMGPSGTLCSKGGERQRERGGATCKRDTATSLRVAELGQMRKASLAAWSLHPPCLQPTRQVQLSANSPGEPLIVLPLAARENDSTLAAVITQRCSYPLIRLPALLFVQLHNRNPESVLQYNQPFSVAISSPSHCPSACRSDSSSSNIQAVNNSRRKTSFTHSIVSQRPLHLRRTSSAVANLGRRSICPSIRNSSRLCHAASSDSSSLSFEEKTRRLRKMSPVTKNGSNAFTKATASVDIPKPHARDSGFFVGGDSFAAVTPRSLPTYHHAQMLPTPPNSISPSLPPHGFKLQGPASQIDSDIDLQEEATEIQHHEAVQPQHGFAVTNNESDVAGLDAAGAITPALLAKHHLSEILLAHGPLAIRHVMGYLTTSVPGFSRIPPAKARRLVVGALEGRGNGGEGGEFNGDVLFEKVGWGRWDARIKGQPPRENRGIQQSTLVGGNPSPPASVPSSYSAGGLPIPNVSGWMERSRTDQPSTSWAGDSAIFSHDDEMDQEDITMLEHEADKMSLDGDESCSSSEAPEDGLILEEELDDITDDEDWAQIGAAALRQGSFPAAASSGCNYISSLVHSGDRGGGPSSAALAKSMPSSFIHNSRELTEYVGFSHTAGFGVGSDSQEREAIEALVRLSSV